MNRDLTARDLMSRACRNAPHRRAQSRDMILILLLSVFGGVAGASLFALVWGVPS